ncbi:MAG: NADPH-dependent 7-cyano-7-deazaguanine reductase QueF [Pseudomonadales bacterium]|uniref:NADPH-dependent 7-cyano-7-deazaguanine reductase n=1 Tax=Oleiphilus messinensis TaxID=141451 RepID=A0A1Y0IAB9_9GAMM|nr:NADPH-dependent 7-cyano-7-deazaguanine reductase QueF [Oleiphilus messinensis]ARU57109.1 GTP cyclohydrolase I family protein [Oleiphilus messinensis]MCG8609109.1 NADPH-dependent 7-cyano-7-deazaguanine reductase QueF [Pseudomonadales bacterium]
MSELKNAPLGKQTLYVSEYDPSLLFPIARALNREELNIGTELPFFGIDLWTGYELSWLDYQGKPQVAIAVFRFPCESRYIIESKSFKLYLNSYNQTRFASSHEVRVQLQKDLAGAVGCAVSVDVHPVSRYLTGEGRDTPSNALDQFVLLDELDVTIDDYQYNPQHLSLNEGSQSGHYRYLSHLLKSNCPVTGQPDWATVYIDLQGEAPDPEGLLKYIISFREYQDFHEHCVEKIYVDLMRHLQPQELTVWARYTRRGGMDINPYRSSSNTRQFDFSRTERQ